jgi:hypothetical protein
MALDFPDSPTTGQIVSSPRGTFIWDGTKWAPATAGGFGDAPTDGKQYARQSAARAAIGAAAGGLVAFNSYSSSQTITIPAGATKAMVELWGGTGGSGGISGSYQSTTGGSGAGGFLRKFLTGMTAGNTLALMIGAAGAAGTASPLTAGGNGGSSTLASGTQTIGTLTGGGSPGTASAPGTVYPNSDNSGGAGGTASGGDFNLNGAPGQMSNNGFVDSCATTYDNISPPSITSAAHQG